MTPKNAPGDEIGGKDDERATLGASLKLKREMENGGKRARAPKGPRAFRLLGCLIISKK